MPSACTSFCVCHQTDPLRGTRLLPFFPRCWQVLRMYPALKDSKNDLEFGYKIEYEALTEKQEVTVRTGLLSNIHANFFELSFTLQAHH